MSQIKAYIVRDDDRHENNCCIRFARSAVVARREGSNEIDSEFECVECRRAPQFDEFAPGPVPPLELLDAGWWFECAGCGIRVDSDCYDYDNDVPLKPVAYGDHGVCCTQQCMDDDDAERAETKRRQIAAIATLTEWVCRNYRGCLLEGAPHAYVTRRSDKDYSWWSEEQVIVHFTFPGARYGGATARIEKGVTSLWVVNGDKDAWHDWHTSMRNVR